MAWCVARFVLTPPHFFQLPHRQLVHGDAEDEQQQRLPLRDSEDAPHDHLEEHGDGEHLDVVSRLG